MIPDLATLTDTELGELYTSLTTEQNRRARLAEIPARVSEMTLQYEADGGSRSELTDAVSSATHDSNDGDSLLSFVE